MEIKKIFFGLACLSVLTLTSCYDEKGDDYTPATKEAGAFLYAASTDVKFAADDEQVLTIMVGRTESSVSSATLTCDNSKFNVPSSVSLSSDLTTVSIPFNMQGGTTETVTFTINDGSPYGAKNLTMNVTRDFVWVNIGTGLFTSAFFQEAWEQVVLQAEGTQKYILPNVYRFDGYDLAFELTDDGTALASTIKAFEIGYVHPTYGMIRGRNLDLEGHPMVRDGNAITIPLQFIVDAGSFGWANETIELPE